MANNAGRRSDEEMEAAPTGFMDVPLLTNAVRFGEFVAGLPSQVIGFMTPSRAPTEEDPPAGSAGAEPALERRLSPTPSVCSEGSRPRALPDPRAGLFEPPLPPFGFSFAPAGLLFPYHYGVASYLQHAGFLNRHTPLMGSSAGALVTTCLALELDASAVWRMLYGLETEFTLRGTRGRMKKHVRAGLEEILPPDAHTRLNERPQPSFIMYTALKGPYMKARYCHKFDNRADLIQCLLGSCNIPMYFTNKPWVAVRGDWAVDGYFSDVKNFGCPPFAPYAKVKRQVRVMPFEARKILAHSGANSPLEYIAPDLAVYDHLIPQAAIKEFVEYTMQYPPPAPESLGERRMSLPINHPNKFVPYRALPHSNEPLPPKIKRERRGSCISRGNVKEPRVIGSNPSSADSEPKPMSGDGRADPANARRAATADMATAEPVGAKATDSVTVRPASTAGSKPSSAESEVEFGGLIDDPEVLKPAPDYLRLKRPDLQAHHSIQLPHVEVSNAPAEVQVNEEGRPVDTTPPARGPQTPADEDSFARAIEEELQRNQETIEQHDSQMMIQSGEFEGMFPGADNVFKLVTSPRKLWDGLTSRLMGELPADACQPIHLMGINLRKPKSGSIAPAVQQETCEGLPYCRFSWGRLLQLALTPATESVVVTELYELGRADAFRWHQLQVREEGHISPFA